MSSSLPPPPLPPPFSYLRFVSQWKTSKSSLQYCHVNHDGTELEFTTLITVEAPEVYVSDTWLEAGHRDGSIGNEVIRVELVRVVDCDVQEPEALHLCVKGERFVENGVETIVVNNLCLANLGVTWDSVEFDLDVRVDNLALGASSGLGELTCRHDLDLELDSLRSWVGTTHGVEAVSNDPEGLRLEDVAGASVVEVLSVVEVHLKAGSLVVKGDNLGTNAPRWDGVVVGAVNTKSSGINPTHLPGIVVSPLGGGLGNELLGLGLGE